MYIMSNFSLICKKKWNIFVNINLSLFTFAEFCIEINSFIYLDFTFLNLNSSLELMIQISMI